MSDVHKLTSRNPCGTNMCSCCKNGLKCVTACGDCQGLNGQNSGNITELEEDSLELEDDNLTFKIAV